METIGADLRQMQRTPPAASHVQALRAEGKIAAYSAGTSDIIITVFSARRRRQLDDRGGSLRLIGEKVAADRHSAQRPLGPRAPPTRARLI